MARPIALLRVADGLSDVLAAPLRDDVCAALSEFVRARRWFSGKAHRTGPAQLFDQIPIHTTGGHQLLVLLAMGAERDEPDVYAVALGLATGPRADELAARMPHAVVARVEIAAREGEEHGYLIDAFASGDAAYALLELMASERVITGERATLRGEGREGLQALYAQRPRQPVDAGTREQSNTVIAIGQSALLKAYRKLQPGVHCEIEIGRHLSADPSWNGPRLLGTMHYQREGEAPAVIASVQSFVANQGDAWTLMLKALDGFLQWVASERPSPSEARPPDSLMARSRCAPPSVLQQRCALDFERIRLLGRRTAEMHRALGAPSADPAFEREPFSSEYQAAVYEAAAARLARLIEASRREARPGSTNTQALLAALGEQAPSIEAILRQIQRPDFAIERVRCHGDLHLGQVLFTGDDFVIIDFEGEPARPLHERRLKQCVLRDVMGMTRSLSYAGDMAQRERGGAGGDSSHVQQWAQAWATWMAAAYLSAYLDTLGSSPLVPGQDLLSDAMLDFYELDKALYEVEYELGSRPDWIDIPLLGIARIVERWRSRSAQSAAEAPQAPAECDLPA